MNVYLWRDLERDKVYVKDEAGNKFDVPCQVQQAYRQEYESVLKMAEHYREKARSLEDDVRRLEWDNKELREELEAVEMAASNLKEDNAKLRGIVRRLWPPAKAYAEMLPMLGFNVAGFYDIALELKEET